MRRWQLQEAKARLSAVVKCSLEEGPQEISVRGEPAVVVIARTEWERLQRPRASFVELMRRSPLVGVELDLERDRTPARDVDL
jgi:antitoxin Phd